MATVAPWMEKPSLLSQIAKAVILILITFVMLFPFVYVIAMSFSTQADVQRGGLVLFPQNPSLEAYRAIFRGGIVVRALGVSALVTVGGTLINMIMTVSLAYGLSKPGVPGSRFVLWMVLFTLLFGAGLIPNYLLIQRLGLINSLWALMLPGAISAFNLVVIRNFFMSLPSELIESARLDGASDWQVLWNIVLPLSKAVLAVIALFYGVGHWNDFFAATLYLNDTSLWPVQLVLRQYVLQGTALITPATVGPDTPLPPAQTVQMAVVVIATLPILLVYPFLQKYFARGVLTGAIKG